MRSIFIRRAFVLVLVAVVLCASLYAEAQNTANRGIVVSPQRVMFVGNERVKEIVIANRGNKAAQYRISVVNRAMTEDGQIKEADAPAENEFFADDVINFGPRRVMLAPRGNQKVRIMSRLRGNAEDGEYRSHLLIQEIPEADPAENAAGQAGTDDLGINIQAIFGVTIPVIVQKGDLDFSAKLVNPRIITENGQKFLKVTIERSGNKSLFGTVKVFTNDKEVGILKNVAVYLSTPRRDVKVNIDPAYAENLSGKTIQVVYDAVEPKEDAPRAELSFVAK